MPRSWVCCAFDAQQGGYRQAAPRYPETIGERLVADTAALRALPAGPLEPCEKRTARVSSMALVRYRTNDYSAPTAYLSPMQLENQTRQSVKSAA
jgi:hypothetical protein